MHINFSHNLNIANVITSTQLKQQITVPGSFNLYLIKCFTHHIDTQHSSRVQILEIILYVETYTCKHTSKGKKLFLNILPVILNINDILFSKFSLELNN